VKTQDGYQQRQRWSRDCAAARAVPTKLVPMSTEEYASALAEIQRSPSSPVDSFNRCSIIVLHIRFTCRCIPKAATDYMRTIHDFMFSDADIDKVCTELALQATAKALIAGRLFALYDDDAQNIHKEVSKKCTNLKQDIRSLVITFKPAVMPLTVAQIEELSTLVAVVAKVFGVHHKVFTVHCSQTFAYPSFSGSTEMEGYQLGSHHHGVELLGATSSRGVISIMPAISALAVRLLFLCTDIVCHLH
jgi:hypothetical protein